MSDTQPSASPSDYVSDGMILLGRSDNGPEVLELKLANRHGLVTGAG
jgi:hypothetical protein